MMTKYKFLKAGGWSVEFAQRDRGVTLVETMIAVLVAMIGVFGLGSLIFQATVTNKNQGTEVTRATIYAQDKMEKLLSFGAAGADTSGLAVANQVANYKTCTVAPSSQPSVCNSSGVTDSGWKTGLVAGGVAVSTPANMPTSCPSSGSSVGYVDFIDANGLKETGSCSTINSSGFAYIRMWQITNVTSGGAPITPNLKQINVGVWAKSAISTTGAPKPVVVLTSYMSNPN
jgi:Tfp pilus assembly protein PilV